MTFRAPSLPAYLTSLVIACLVAGGAYFALKGTSNGLLLITVGLVIGHFFGSWFGEARATTGTAAARPKTSRPAPPKPVITATAEASGETKSIYVGNVAFSAPKEALQELFSAYGPVRSVRLMTDRATRRPRGYGFVEMDGPAADAAIAALDGHEFFGRVLRVNEAKQRDPRQED